MPLSQCTRNYRPVPHIFVGYFTPQVNDKPGQKVERPNIRGKSEFRFSGGIINCSATRYCSRALAR
jgi:hypothetical protein